MTKLHHIIGVAALAASLAPSAMAADKSAPAMGLGAKPPAGAVVLFDGKSTAAWENPWKIDKGAMVAGNGSTTSKEKFADALVHVEFRTPNMPEAKGQAKGNSGVYLQTNYEVQVLDSYGVESPGRGDCGAIYNISAPLVKATKPPMQWQSYDIVFRAPRFGADGKKTESARITVIHNGLIVQNNTEVTYPTFANPGAPEAATGSLLLQDHGNPVSYRNIWVLPLPASGADHY